MPVDRFKESGIRVRQSRAIRDGEEERSLVSGIAKSYFAERLLLELEEAVASEFWVPPGPWWLEETRNELKSGLASKLTLLRVRGICSTIDNQKRRGFFIGPIQRKVRPRRPCTEKWIANREAFDEMTKNRPLKPPGRR